MKYYFSQKTQLGYITIVEENLLITAMHFGRIKDGCRKLTPLLKRAFRCLEEYFDGRLTNFDLPLCPKGTEFQKKIWAELLKIPYGETRTYKQIAAAAANPKAARAAGAANNKNPLPIFIPCHRVISSNGNLSGYNGGIDIKKKLLEIEKAI